MFQFIRDWLVQRKRRIDFFRELDGRPVVISQDENFRLAIELIADAFRLPNSYSRKLVGTDGIATIYSCLAGVIGDHGELETLGHSVEELLKRKLDCEEAEKVETIGDIAKLISKRKNGMQLGKGKRCQPPIRLHEQ